MLAALAACLCSSSRWCCVINNNNQVLEDQYCSVPIWKQKLNPWEQRKQFYKPSCCSGPLETPPGALACWSVGGNKGTHPVKFLSGQARFSSVLITTAIHRLQTKWRSFITWHAPCCWLSISVVGAEQAEQKKAGGRALSLYPELGSSDVSHRTLQRGTNIPRSTKAASSGPRTWNRPQACPAGCEPRLLTMPCAHSLSFLGQQA